MFNMKYGRNTELILQLFGEDLKDLEINYSVSSHTHTHINTSSASTLVKYKINS